jgi:hypothetical protein
MYHHIKSVHDAFYLPALQGRPRTPRPQGALNDASEFNPDAMQAQELDSSSSSEHHDPEHTSDSSAEFDPATTPPHDTHPVQANVSEIQRLLRELEHCHPRHLLSDLTAEDKAAAHTIEEWKRKYENKKQQLDDFTANVHEKSEKYDELVSALGATITLLQGRFSDYKKTTTETANAKTDLEANLKLLQEEHERKNNEFLTKLQELNETNEKEQKEMNDRHVTEKRVLVEQAAADAKRHSEDMNNVMKEHDAQTRTLQETHDTVLTEQNKRNEELTQQLQQTQDLLTTKYKPNTDFHTLQEQLNALRAENDTLKNAPPPPTDDTALLDAQAQLRAAQAQVAALKAALQQQSQSAARSRARSHDLEAELLQITQSLRDKVAQNRQGIRELKHNIAQNTTKRISASDLLQKLIAKDYVAIRRVVVATPTPKRKYSTAATYLHLESMGATWCVYEVNEQKIAKLQPGPERTELEKKRLTVLRQMIYDLTIWFSIDNAKHTRYASAHVAAFIHNFGLENNEPADGGQASTDDEREPPAPLPTLAQLTNQPAT